MSGSTFTDWQQELEDERPLLIDDDFSWSDLPARRSRRAPAPAASRSSPPRRSERNSVSERSAYVPAERDAQTQARRTEAEFEQARRGWAASYEQVRRQGSASAPPTRPSVDMDADGVDVHAGSVDTQTDVFDRDDAASYATARVLEDRSGSLDLRHSGRRTVIITGRGDSRYTIAPTRRRSSELRFHERTVFNPDRTAKWAVLLGIALLIGCIAH